MMDLKKLGGLFEELFFELTKNKIDEFDWEEYTFKNKIECYHYDFTRGKTNNIRLKLIKEKNNICNKCKLTYTNKLLELDHKIPVILAGEIYKKKNLQILCKGCHTNKTYIDLKIIRLLKSFSLIKVLKNQGNVLSLIPPEDLKKLYPSLFNLVFKLHWVWGNGWFSNRNYHSYCKNLWREDVN